MSFSISPYTAPDPLTLTASPDEGAALSAQFPGVLHFASPAAPVHTQLLGSSPNAAEAVSTAAKIAVVIAVFPDFFMNAPPCGF